VLSESVAQRTHEIGIRLALGAHPRDLMKLILGQALKLTGIGLTVALPISFAISRAMASLIFGVVSEDFTIVAGFNVLLLAVALAAGIFPRGVPSASIRWFRSATSSVAHLCG
jgi:putative ABC transport system permease protein